MSQVSHVFLATGPRRPMREVEAAAAVADRGLQGCRHARTGSKRQVLLMDGETLDAFSLHPGEIKENITTAGLRVNDLPRGERLAIGEAILEVTGPCDPCLRMDEIRMGLQQELQGQRGTLCRVIEGGRIQRGDSIQIQPASASLAEPQIGGKL